MLITIFLFVLKDIPRKKNVLKDNWQVAEIFLLPTMTQENFDELTMITYENGVMQKIYCEDIIDYLSSRNIIWIDDAFWYNIRSVYYILHC
jgi:hypothetical protein